MKRTESTAIIPAPKTDLAPAAELVDSARAYAAAAMAESTARAYRADWSHFTDWCAARGFTPMPATAETVGLYITDMADAGLKPATIDRRLATIRKAHRAAGIDAPASEGLRAPLVARAGRHHRRAALP